MDCSAEPPSPRSRPLRGLGLGPRQGRTRVAEGERVGVSGVGAAEKAPRNGAQQRRDALSLMLSRMMF
eukprot:6179669-Pleurochrysis_carterae.AAC.1